MHIDDLSVQLKIRDGLAVEEHHAPQSHGEDYTKTKLSRALVTIDADIGLQIILKPHQRFDFSQSEGLRVAIALGPKKPASFFPSKVQYWWIPFASLDTSREPEIVWNEHWNWNIKDAGNSTDGENFTPQRPFDSEIAQNLYNLEWRPLTEAPEGCIAIHVGFGIAPPVPLAVGKGPALYVPLDSVISHVDWFRPSQSKEHKIYGFEFRIIDPSDFEPSAVSTASKPKEEISKRSPVEAETQNHLGPKHQNDKAISASTGEHTRRSKRIASSTVVDYNIKKRRRVISQEPNESISRRSAKNGCRPPTLSSRLTENLTPKQAASVDAFESAETLLAKQQTQSDCRARHEIALSSNSRKLEAPPSLPNIARDSSERPAQATAENHPSTADASVKENEQREIRRARLDYELLMAQNRANELRRAIELEEKFGVSFRD